MPHRSLTFAAVFCAFVATTLGCSLVERVVSQAVDEATGGAVSTIESLSSEALSLPVATPALPGGFPSATEDASAPQGEGTISGSLSYPSEGIPALRIIAFDASGQAPVATVQTAPGDAGYSLSVPYGGYYVVAYTLDGRLAGGYSLAVLCGLSVDCTDHTLVPVVVAPGQDAAGIDPADWYAPEGSFPAMP